MKKDNAHEFAVFIGTSKIAVNQSADTIIIADHDLMTRIITVLRLKIGKSITLFDTRVSYACVLTEINKKNLLCTVTSSAIITQKLPEIQIVLPVLERDALEDAVYMATVYGVKTVQLVATQKSRPSLTEKEYLRLEKIAIAAAEQSKQFCLPMIKKLVTLETFLLDSTMAPYKDAARLWSDTTGKNILTTVARIQKTDTYLVTLGPEGDFTADEKALLKKYFTPVKLTHSILRSKDAARLLLGILAIAHDAA